MEKKYLIILSTVILSVLGAASLVYFDPIRHAQATPPASGGKSNKALIACCW